MTPRKAVADLERARDLQRRALNNHAKFLRAGAFGKTAREALERYEKMSEEADALVDGVMAYLSTL